MTVRRGELSFNRARFGLLQGTHTAAFSIASDRPSAFSSFKTFTGSPLSIKLTPISFRVVGMDSACYSNTQFGVPRRTVGAHEYTAYFAKPIPRSLELTADTVSLLAEAEAALGRLAGMAPLLPNPRLFIEPYMAREALASTRIEGTHASLDQVFENEAVGAPPNADVEAVLNYLKAMNLGIQRLKSLPISGRFICELHSALLAGVRGRERSPGVVRTTQNWIGSPGATIDTATFVPPPAAELDALITDWEEFANESGPHPLLVRCALLHYQFETLHPFLDGNGRLGRLLIPLFLVAQRRLDAPLLYLSPWVEQRRDAYYDRLQGVRERGDIAGWLNFLFEGIATQADDAVQRSLRLIVERDRYREMFIGKRKQSMIALIDIVIGNPIVSARIVEQRANVSRPTSLTWLREFQDLGILTPAKSGQRGQQRWVAHDILEIIAADSQSAT